MLQLVHLQLVFSSSLSITSRWRINIFLSSGLSRINPQSYNHQFQQTQAWTWHPLLTTSFFNQPGSYQCSIAWCNKLHTRFFSTKSMHFFPEKLAESNTQLAKRELLIPAGPTLPCHQWIHINPWLKRHFQQVRSWHQVTFAFMIFLSLSSRDGTVVVFFVSRPWLVFFLVRQQDQVSKHGVEVCWRSKCDKIWQKSVQSTGHGTALFFAVGVAIFFNFSNHSFWAELKNGPSVGQWKMSSSARSH